MPKLALSDAIQDYLKALYHLQTGEGRVSVTALAREQKVSPASASAMVKKLAALELVEHAPYRGVRLTAAGEKVAVEVIRHHRLLELYLHEHLGVTDHEERAAHRAKWRAAASVSAPRSARNARCSCTVFRVTSETTRATPSSTR